MTVIKRDGREVVFDASKISEAVKKAAKQVDKGLTSETVKLANDIACKIEIECLDMESPPNIEDIQNRVEEELMGSSRKDIARAYITYRNERTRKREQNSSLILLIGEKLMATNVQKQNANLDENSFGGRLGEARNVVAKEYALNHLLSPMARNHHVNNEIYEHDLDSFAVGLHNCLTVPVDKLLANGFSVKKVGSSRQKDIRPASNIMSAMQLIAVIFQAQSLCMFGGVSASHLDYTMVPYVRKTFARHFKTGMKYIKHDPDFEIPGKGMDVSITDPLYCTEPEVYQYALDLTMKDTDQAAESLFHNLNTLQSRSGNQLPFSSINFGTCTLPEGRMVIKALLNSSLAGLGSHHKTSVFPCSIFKCKKGINLDPGDPNYDLFKLALKSSSQRLYPNYGNVDWSGNAGYDPNDPCTEFATMGCRTFTGWDINGFGQRKDGRGNIAPVTIVLPTVAMYTLNALKDDGIDIEEASDDLIIDRFNSILDTYIEDAKEMLLERFRHIASQKADSAIFMYQNGCMEGFDGKDIISALKHGTLAIGQLGLAETLQILLKCDHTEERGMLAAKKIEQLFKDRCAEYKQQYRLNFGVYYTPAENLCYTALQKFRDRYGVIPNVSDKEFFTNSIHVPVWKEIDPFEKINIEAQLTGYSSAGCITYVELDATAKNNLDALEQLVKYAMSKNIPYFAVNVPNDICMECGYTDEIGDACPICGSRDIQRLRRVTGYLTGDYMSSFNKGKQDEVRLRYQHTKRSSLFHPEGTA